MILLVGAGLMAKEYSKVLSALNQNFIIVGRGEDSAAQFEESGKYKVVRGGLEHYLRTTKEIITDAIISVSIEELACSTIKLLQHGVKNILVEKPAALNSVELKKIAIIAKENRATVSVGYNRRFYSSVLAAKKIIKQDGGVQSFTFEITERSYVIESLSKHKEVKENWFLANTSHVVDLAFHLGGSPEKLVSFTSGATIWHSLSAVFAGAGKSINGALFSYTGNWNAPGSWSIDILTHKRRLIFKPLEKLREQVIGSTDMQDVVTEDGLDREYKPGLFLQVQAFLNQDESVLCSLSHHVNNTEHYIEMAGYN